MPHWTDKIPETEKSHSPIVLPPFPAPFLEHISVPLADVAELSSPPARKLELLLNADYLRIVTDFPVVVELDGRVITASGMGTSYAPNFISDDPTDNAGALLCPSVDFEVIGYPFRTLSLSMADIIVSGNDLLTEQVLGQIEIYYGRGPVRSHGPGWPVSYTLEYTQSRPAAGTISTEPLWPTMGINLPGGNNLASPSGTRWFPHRLQVTGWSYIITWDAAVGATNIARLLYRNEVGTANVGLWTRAARDDGFGNDPTVYEWDMRPPIEIPGYVIRPDVGSLGGGIILQVEATAPMTAVKHCVNFRGWM